MSPLFRRRHTGGDPDGELASAGADHDQPADEVEDIDDENELDDEDEEFRGLPERPDGPWDVSEAPDTEGMIDLGSLRVRGRDGMELRLEVQDASGQITTVTIQLSGSAVQLQAFAAPRSEGIWDEVRAEIAAGITAQGGTADEGRGAFGPELIARIPVRNAEGRSGVQPARFVGIDGPRWFLRAVFHGPAVYDPEAAALLESVVKDVVVVRGPDAMAPRELLPLRLPTEAAAQLPEGTEEERPPIEPFRRGPEITEVR